jgi:repressor LexA
MATYTAKQRQVLQFIRRSFEDLGIAPTLEEIAYELGGITRVAVLDHLRALERKGAIQRRARECRAIEILDPDYTPCRGLPLEGTIAAGEPIMAAAQREDITLEQYLGVDDGCFLLRVRGNSMIEDHIMDGDLVLVESSKSARDGETVVAVIGEENVTLKRLYREGDQVRLQPANSGMTPKYVNAQDVGIRGVVRGVIRRT